MNKLFVAALSAALCSFAHAQTQDELLRDGNGGSSDNVLTYGMGYHQQRYSPLAQVNKRTVTTTVELADGQTFAIAGLLNSNIAATRDVTPLLGDLPVVGSLIGC